MASPRQLASVTALSEELHVPPQEVEQVYHAQLERLRGSARIRNYLVMLAAGRTRSILWAATHQGHGV